tara:strand:- start:1482 stop:3305 length:1824 start_codon:yes stop_codon:yes gene_type:complete
MNKESFRYKVIASTFALVVLIFLFKIFHIQIISNNYKFSANNNVLRYEVQDAVRGLIFDRNHNLIVANVPAYDLIIVPIEFQKKTIDTAKLCALLKISKASYLEKYTKALNYSAYKESIFIKHLDIESASKIGEQLYNFPGLYLKKITMREYPTSSATHVIGYLSEVSSLQTKNDTYYTNGDLFGVSGVEGAYEKKLRGTKGLAIKLVDVHNRDQGKFKNGEFDISSKNGKSIITTIDIKLQEYGEKLMKNKVGAIVALEPNSGEILALISSPSYNPNLLIGRDRSINYKDLLNDVNKPLFNRAIQAEYPPGSIFKLINGLIGLQEGIIKQNTIFSCDNGIGYEYSKKKYVGCHPHKSPLNLSKSIEISCNTYFCNLYNKYFKKFNSSKDAYENWHKHVRSFGIGNYLNNDFISGSPGKLPLSSYFNKLYKGSWNSNTIISMAIGQGELLLTPIQMANLTAIIANRGFYYTPHIIKKIDEENTIDSSFTTKKFSTIKPEFFPPIIEAMNQVTEGNDGTAKNGRIDDIKICGKTGTAQNPHGDDHSIYIAFAPKENPKIAVAVYVENGGWGSKWAVPIGTLLIEKYLKKNISNKSQENFILNSKINNL